MPHDTDKMLSWLSSFLNSQFPVHSSELNRTEWSQTVRLMCADKSISEQLFAYHQRQHTHTHTHSDNGEELPNARRKHLTLYKLPTRGREGGRRVELELVSRLKFYWNGNWYWTECCWHHRNTRYITINQNSIRLRYVVSIFVIIFIWIYLKKSELRMIIIRIKLRINVSAT